MDSTNSLAMAHLAGEAQKLVTTTGEGADDPLTVLDTVGRRIRVEWDPAASVTPMGQVVYFSGSSPKRVGGFAAFWSYSGWRDSRVKRAGGHALSDSSCPLAVERLGLSCTVHSLLDVSRACDPEALASRMG